MSSIFGILNMSCQSIDPGVISRINKTAIYLLPRKIASLEITGGYMAVAVLNVNSLVTGTDSMLISNDFAVIADAKLYKRKELIHKLGMDLNNNTASDTMLILQSYLKWNRDCLKYLYGDFAFVIFSLKTGEIFCGRDPLGVHPFFFAMQKETFVFGSELRYVLASFKIRPSLCQAHFLDTLVTVKSVKELSPFENIFRLKPGHCLYKVGEHTNIYQYWNTNPERKIEYPDESHYVELFRETLVRAVHMRCDENSSFGFELSGGLDSSAVTGIAAEYCKGRPIQPVVFSNIFPGNTGIEYRDEMEFITHMQKYKSLEWIGIDRLPHSIPVLLQHEIDIQGCFIQQTFSTFNHGLYKAAGECGVQVLFSGFGGDEMVSAQINIPWNELINDRQWRIIIDELCYKGVTLKSILKTWRIAYRYIKSRAYHPKYRYGFFTPDFLNKRFQNLPLMPIFVDSNNLRNRFDDKHRVLSREKVSYRLSDRIMHEHIPQRMEYCYAAAAQYGIEYRYPLLDIDLIETYLAFPPWLKQHNGINRYVFRQAIQGFVPEEIRHRNDKSGSTIPQLYESLLKERENILQIAKSCSNLPNLKKIIDFSRFPYWYEKLARRDRLDMNYLNPGAFYDYLMMMLYFKDHD